MYTNSLKYSMLLTRDYYNSWDISKKVHDILKAENEGTLKTGAYYEIYIKAIILVRNYFETIFIHFHKKH